MGDFGNKARKFMGWYSADELEDDLLETTAPEELAPVAEIAPLEPVAPLRREENRAVSSPAADLSRIVTVHPNSYSDALAIGEAFRDGVPVIVNLSDLNEAEARRVVDFAAGLTFGLHGVIERVTNRVFLLSPRSVEVESDASSRRASLFS